MIPREPDHWQVDRKIPLALIGAVLLQTAGMSWWASGMSMRVEQLERQAAGISSQSERIVRLEEKVGGIQQGIAEIKAMLQRANVPGVPRDQPPK
jgi:hypothetical protein